MLPEILAYLNQNLDRILAIVKSDNEEYPLDAQSFKVVFFLEKDLVRANKDVFIESTTLYAKLLTDVLIEAFLGYGKLSFSFETVFSHPSKLRLFEKAKVIGFKTYLYFIATKAPDINLGRIVSRVKQGGHGVPDDKVVKRWRKSIENLRLALRLADRAFVFDNSGSEYYLLAEKKDGKLAIELNSIPEWFHDIVLSAI